MLGPAGRVLLRFGSSSLIRHVRWSEVVLTPAKESGQLAVTRYPADVLAGRANWASAADRTRLRLRRGCSSSMPMRGTKSRSFSTGHPSRNRGLPPFYRNH